MYAGGVKGLKTTVKALQENTKLIIVTVGLADVTNEENTNNIKKSISRQVPDRIMKDTTIFHLRGMTLLYNKAKNLPEEKKDAETRAMIETFNKAVDFTDYNALKAIMDVL